MPHAFKVIESMFKLIKRKAHLLIIRAIVQIFNLHFIAIKARFGKPPTFKTKKSA